MRERLRQFFCGHTIMVPIKSVRCSERTTLQTSGAEVVVEWKEASYECFDCGYVDVRKYGHTYTNDEFISEEHP